LPDPLQGQTHMALLDCFSKRRRPSEVSYGVKRRLEIIGNMI